MLLAAIAGAQAPEADPVAIGRRVYLDGRLSSGEPVRATVQGDVEVDGSLFSCVSCHRRSGMGAIEGDRIVTAVAGRVLYAPRPSGYAPRPAYTDETVARMVREGVDSGGRVTDPLMPLYSLPDREMEGLIAYLKTLSSELSPGVSEDEIRFATVVAGDVPREEREAMLEVLETFFVEKNRGTRHETLRKARGPFYREYRDKAYRSWVLDTWELTGPPGDWPAQLEARYERRPVFGVVSGVATGEWRPIHEFCEAKGLPCLLPNTDLPPDVEGDFYTLYFSKGLSLEARTIVRHLTDAGEASRLLLVYRPERLDAAAAAAAVRAAARSSEGIEAVEWRLSEAAPDGASVAERLREEGAAAAVLLVGRDDLDNLARGWRPGLPLYFSSTLLGGSLEAVPEPLRRGAFAAHPFTLPEERVTRARGVRAWLRSRGIGGVHERIRSQTYFACMITRGAIGRINQYLNRDYFMDSLEHGDRMAAYSAYYPRLSFGPEQRYLAKGCYIVRLDGPPGPPREERAFWIVP